MGEGHPSFGYPLFMFTTFDVELPILAWLYKYIWEVCVLWGQPHHCRLQNASHVLSATAVSCDSFLSSPPAAMVMVTYVNFPQILSLCDYNSPYNSAVLRVKRPAISC